MIMIILSLYVFIYAHTYIFFFRFISLLDYYNMLSTGSILDSFMEYKPSLFTFICEKKRQREEIQLTLTASLMLGRARQGVQQTRCPQPVHVTSLFLPQGFFVEGKPLVWDRKFLQSEVRSSFKNIRESFLQLVLPMFLREASSKRCI